MAILGNSLWITLLPCHEKKVKEKREVHISKWGMSSFSRWLTNFPKVSASLVNQPGQSSVPLIITPRMSCISPEIAFYKKKRSGEDNWKFLQASIWCVTVSSATGILLVLISIKWCVCGKQGQVLMSAKALTLLLCHSYFIVTWWKDVARFFFPFHVLLVYSKLHLEQWV